MNYYTEASDLNIARFGFSETLIWSGLYGSLGRRQYLYIDMPSGIKTIYAEAPCQWQIGNEAIKLAAIKYLY